MENLERMCTVDKGAEAFALATVMFEYNIISKKTKIYIRLGCWANY